MGSFSNGVYVPAIGEVGWGTNVNDFLTRSGEAIINVKQLPYAATGDGSTDDTAAFVAAEAAAGTGGRMLIPPGTYRLNNWTPTHNYMTIEGAGKGATLKAKASATYALTLSSRLYTTMRDLIIDGNAKAASGLCITTDGVTGAQGQMLDRLKFQNCLVGVKVENGGAVNQTDKNIYLGCQWADNTTGLWLFATNSQEQLLLGGSFDTHTTAVRMTSGSFTWIGGQVQVATTAFKIDGAVVWMNLRDVITEGTTTDIDGTASAWPANGVQLESCLLQASSYCVNTNLAGAILQTRGCTFFTGAINFSANDAMWSSTFDTLSFGAAWTASGVNYRRILTDNNGTHYYFNSTSTPVGHAYITGEFEGKGLATQVVAGIPNDSNFVFPVTGMIAVDSSNNRLYVRVGSTWKYAALT